MPRRPYAWFSLILFQFIFAAQAGRAAELQFPLLQDLREVWRLHLENPPLEKGCEVWLQPVADSYDVPARWDDGVDGTHGIYAPTPLPFIGYEEDEWIRVKESGTPLLLSRQYFSHHVKDKPKLLQRKMVALRQPELNFIVGENVRYRREGWIRNGVVTALDAKNITRSNAGREFVVPRESVFKRVKGSGQTISYYNIAERWEVEITNISGESLAFLNHVARWTSSDAFLKMSDREQVEAMSHLVVAFFPWHDCAKNVDADEPVTLNDLIRLGHGVCRHLAVLTVLLLEETGFPAETWAVDNHRWVEVRLPGHSESLIVESSREKFSPKPYTLFRSEISEHSSEGEQEFNRNYYSNPERSRGFHQIRISEER